MSGRLLPADGDDRFVMRIEALGDDLPFTFLEPGDDGTYGYVHMGARLHRRVASWPQRPRSGHCASRYRECG